jgi:hypothetical protein
MTGENWDSAGLLNVSATAPAEAAGTERCLKLPTDQLSKVTGLAVSVVLC